jgi:multidrug efflux pump subunit AcrB
VVPTLAKFWLRPHVEHGDRPPSRNPLVRIQLAFERGFEALRQSYRTALVGALTRRRVFIPVFLVGSIASLALTPWLGEDFFPTVDGGAIKLHLRGHSGLRVEETTRLSAQVVASLRRIIPPAELASVVSNIGLPVSGINLSYTNSAPVGAGDADIYVTLAENHRPTADYVRMLRPVLAQEFPGTSFAFLPADIVSQILNFGLPAPLDIQITGGNVAANNIFAQNLLKKIRQVPGIADPRIQQAFDYPEFDVAVDRSRAQDLGLQQQNVGNDLLISLSGSFQTAPSFWLDPKNGVSYSVVTQTPQYQLDSLNALRNVPVNNGSGGPAQILGALGTIQRGVGPSVVSHYNVQPSIDIYAAVADRDLGGVAGDIRKIVADSHKDLPRGSVVTIRGQAETMSNSFTALFVGLAFAILLVYLLIVVNFQSWIDPFIIITALPAALGGIVWMLFITRTTLSVPALTGAIMSVGVATANSILVVSFARDRMDQDGCDALTAALDAGFGRFRPVLMTALAMIIGMVPMALGLGEGGEQNAPLGRAVIGGLCFATVATLLFVPAVFCLIHGRHTAKPAHV